MQPSQDYKARFFEKLVEPMRRTMLTFAQARAANPFDAEDIVQEACGVAWEKIDDLMESPNPNGWLMNALKFHILKYYDRVSRDIKIAEALEIDEEADAVWIDAPETRSAASVLNPIDRRIVELRGKGFTHEEIADELGMKHGAVRTRFSRIKDKVEDFMKGTKEIENF